jgi:hypothetical protein
VIVLDQELMTKHWYVARAARDLRGVQFPGAHYDPRDPAGFSMRQFLDANQAIGTIAIYPEWKSGDPSTEGAYEAWSARIDLGRTACCTRAGAVGMERR